MGGFAIEADAEEAGLGDLGLIGTLEEGGGITGLALGRPCGVVDCCGGRKAVTAGLLSTIRSGDFGTDSKDQFAADFVLFIVEGSGEGELPQAP